MNATDTTARYSAWTIYRRLLQHARPYWGHIAALFALGLLSTPLKLLMPVPLKIGVDSVVGDEPLPGFLQPVVPAVFQSGEGALLLFAALLLVLAYLLWHFSQLGHWLLHSYTGQRLTLSLRSRLFRHVQRLSLSHHDRRGSTDATYRIQYDAPAIQWIAVEGVIPFINAGVMVLAMICVIAVLDWHMALVALAIAPVLVVMTRTWGKRLRRQWRDTKKLHSQAMGVVQETMGALRVVKAFNGEDREHERFLDRASHGVRGEMRVAGSQGFFELAVGMTVAVGMAATLFIGIRHVQLEIITLGELLMIWAYLAQLYGPLQTISQKVGTLQGSMASAERVLTLLDASPDVAEKPDARPLKTAAGSVRFESVGFEYRTGQRVLSEVSFDIEPGTAVGILGHTGAGKSTLANLLTRFYDPAAGRILLDGVDLRDYRLDDLRRQYAIVLQDPLLFATSIAENIAYARPEATMGDIIAAAQAAGAHDFIEQLPDGYDTIVGERGMELSGGERQRVSLARAFLKDAPILILDEPTSAVDVRTETIIIQAMQRLMKDRTCFMIAHRLSTLRRCDLLLVLDGGRLIETGTDVDRILAERAQPRPSPVPAAT